MAIYQHKKGIIRDNALEALLHDPLFRGRVEVNKKGKGCYRRKDKHVRQDSREASGKDTFTTGFLNKNASSANINVRAYSHVRLIWKIKAGRCFAVA